MTTATRRQSVLIVIAGIAMLCVSLLVGVVAREGSQTAVLASDQMFPGFGAVEQAPTGAFRWAQRGARIVFPRLWSDILPLPGAAIAQTVTVRLQDEAQVGALLLRETWIPLRPEMRNYRMLVAASAVLDITPRGYSTTADGRVLGVPISVALREQTRWSTPTYVALILYAVLAVVLAVVCATLIDRVFLPTAPPVLATVLHAGVWLLWCVGAPAGSVDWAVGWGFVALSVLLLRWAAPDLRWRWQWLVGLLVVLAGVRLWVTWQAVWALVAAEFSPDRVYDPLPLSGEPYWSWSVWIVIVALCRAVMGVAFTRRRMVLLAAVGCALLSYEWVGFYPAHGWMNMLSLDVFHSWNDVWDFLRTSRVAIPPVLLVMEYALLPHNLLAYGYLWLLPRAIFVAAMLIALLRGSTAGRDSWLRLGILWSWLAAFGVVKNLDNYFVYDAVFGAVLFFAVVMAFRGDIRSWQWLVVGLLLVCVDTLRPFGMLVLAVVVPFLAVQSFRLHGRRGVILLCIPLLLSVGWHVGHFVGNGQANWSNHSGFNLCHAWECPTPPDLEPEAPPLAPGLWANLNTAVHTRNSDRWLHSGLAYHLAHPVEALVFVGVLMSRVLAMPFVGGAPKWIGNGFVIDFWRCVMLLWLLVQCWRCILLGIAWRAKQPVSTEGIVHMLVLLTILVIPNLVESGENYRFIVGTAMWLAALPRWSELFLQKKAQPE